MWTKWDTAFDDAFGVKQFAEFLRKIPEKIGVNLETNTTKIVETLWSDLYEETVYFQKKIQWIMSDVGEAPLLR
jgi:hypothetical protein